MSKLISRNWPLIVPLLLLVFGSVLFVMAAPGEPYNIFAPPEPRTGYDPLASYEVTSAFDLASGEMAARTRSADKLETILVERHQEEKAVYARGTWDRRADVYMYDYSTNEMQYAIVNLTTGNIDHFEKVQGVQLPLTQNELARATAILMADEGEVGQALRDLYRDTFGRELSAADLYVAPFIYKAASRGITDGIKASCGIDRCAELLIETTNDMLIPFNPLVNLSTGQIIGIANQ